MPWITLCDWLSRILIPLQHFRISFHYKSQWYLQIHSCSKETVIAGATLLAVGEIHASLADSFKMPFISRKRCKKNGQIEWQIVYEQISPRLVRTHSGVTPSYCTSGIKLVLWGVGHNGSLHECGRRRKPKLSSVWRYSKTANTTQGNRHLDYIQHPCVTKVFVHWHLRHVIPRATGFEHGFLVLGFVQASCNLFHIWPVPRAKYIP